MTAAAQHRFTMRLREIELELTAHWRDPLRAQRICDALSDAVDEIVHEALEDWYGTDF